MKVKIVNLRKVLIVIAAALLLMCLSELLHNVIESFFFDLVLFALKILIYVIVLFQIVEGITDVVEDGLKYKINTLYTKSVNNPREKFEHYFQANQGNISCQILRQLMVAFYEDERLFNTLLLELEEQYKTNDLVRPIVSYIFLENQNDNDIACFFQKNVEFKMECEKLSRSITEKFVYNLFDSQEKIITMDNFDDVLIGLIHACLPQNHVPKSKLVYILRTILTWVINEISENNLEEHQNTLALFLILLPIIQRKIHDTKIHNEYLDKNILVIQKSKWKRSVINNVCKEIIGYYKSDFININPEQCACNASLLSVYFENVSFFRKIRFYFTVKRGDEKLLFKYAFFTDDEALSLLILLTVFGKINGKKEMVEQAASVMFLCATAPFSPLTKIGGQV